MRTVTATQIAREMKLTPKRVRSILRKMDIKHAGSRWTFPAADKAKIKNLVRNSRKRAAVNRIAAKASRKATPRRRAAQSEQRAYLH